MTVENYHSSFFQVFILWCRMQTAHGTWRKRTSLWIKASVKCVDRNVMPLFAFVRLICLPGVLDLIKD